MNIKEKEELIKKWNDAYYKDNTSLVSDYEYDMTVKEVEKYYREHPELVNNGPTANVGSSLTSNFKKVRHSTPMLSLANSYNMEEVSDFLRRYDITDWVAEQKMDGLSLSIIYRNGEIVGGATRGDGNTGEDVSEGVKMISNVPHIIPVKGYLEVRGEVLLPKDMFQIINDKRKEEGQPLYATSRNLASGTMRQLDVSLVKTRGLRFVAYYIVNAKDYDITTQIDVLRQLEKWGFEVPNSVSSRVIKDLQEAVNRLRGNVIYDTDGVVFKDNELSHWVEFTAKTPKWAFAYKYPTQRVVTKLLDVTWQVGRTGRISPVAELEPVTISGTVVSRATLHNINEIKRKDIRIGDYVVVEKAAEIIPAIVEPILDKRDSNVRTIEVPDVCPECGEKVVNKDSNLYCAGFNCGAKKVNSIVYFADRANMNIMGLGQSTVEKLVDEGLLTDISSIYTLKQHKERLLALDKLSNKSVDNLLDEIEKSRQNSFSRLLGSLGIEGIGRSTAVSLVSVYKDWEELFKGAIEEFKDVKGVGRYAALSYYNWIIAPNKAKEIEKYLQGKGKFESIINDRAKAIIDLHIGESDTAYRSAKLYGKVFAVTGATTVSRDVLRNDIESNGGTFTSSVGNKCTHLIVGLKPTQRKVEAAKKLGIKIISSEQFRKMLD